MNYEDSTSQIIKRVKVEAFEGRPSLQYRIQLVKESLIDKAATFLMKYMESNDNLSRSLGHKKNEKEFKESEDFSDSFWKMLLSKDISLAAILEDDQGNGDRMICCYALGITKKGAKFDLEKIQDTTFYYICKTIEAVMAKADVFESFDCEEYIDGCALATATDFQRRGVAGEVMGACAEVCRLTDIPVCAAVFTAEASQKLAHRYGYKTLSELDLTTFQIDGKIVYPKPEWPVIKLMGFRFF